MAFDPGSLPPAALASLLAAGTFVLVEDEGGHLSSTTGGAVIEAGPGAVRQVLEDFARYREWVPQLTRSEVLGKKGGATDVGFTLSFRFAVFSKNVNYSIRYKRKSEDRLEWERLDGDLEENRGAWSLVSLDRGRRTAAFYSFYVDLSGLGSMVKMALKASPQMEVAIASSTAVLVTRALKARVELAEKG